MRTIEVMRRLNPDEYKLDFCVLSGLPGELDSEIRAMGGEVHYLHLNFGFPARFVRLLRSQQYDVVHSHVHYPSGFLVMLAKLGNVPIRIAHFRTTWDHNYDSWIRRLRDRSLKLLIDQFATHILAVSEGVMELCWTNEMGRDERCKVVYNGIDASRYRIFSGETRKKLRRQLRISPDAPVFIHVGRLTAAKNHQRLISIFSQIRKLHQDAILILVGGGDPELKRELTKSVTMLGLKDSVLFLGVRDDIPTLFPIADCMIFPSLWEGLPGVVLEATAAGVPVLASQISGVQEIADYISSVKSLSLEKTDETWARQALDMVSMPVLQDLGDTPFTLESSVSDFVRIWGTAYSR